jgi:hypothetical protein
MPQDVMSQDVMPHNAGSMPGFCGLYRLPESVFFQIALATDKEIPR